MVPASSPSRPRASTGQVSMVQRCLEVGVRAERSGLAMTVHSQLMPCWVLPCLMVGSQNRTSLLAHVPVRLILFSLSLTTMFTPIHVDPPAELIGVLFPWIEGEIDALQQRRSSNRLAIDIALWQFLHLLTWLRLVLLQDAAILFMQHPECSIFKYAPFNTNTFHTFAAQSISQIKLAQEEARLALQNLPENVASSVRGAVTGFSLEQKCEHEANKVYQDKLLAQLAYLTELSASGCRPSRRQSNFGEYMMYVAIETRFYVLSQSFHRLPLCHPPSLKHLPLFPQVLLSQLSLRPLRIRESGAHLPLLLSNAHRHSYVPHLMTCHQVIGEVLTRVYNVITKVEFK